VGLEICKRSKERVSSEGRAVDRAFDAHHPLVDLKIVADVAAANEALWLVGERHGAKERDRRCCKQRAPEERRNAVLVPGVAGLAADVDAGPRKDWHRRRRRRGQRFGRERGSGESNGSNWCQEELTAHVTSPLSKLNFGKPTLFLSVSKTLLALMRRYF